MSAVAARDRGILSAAIEAGRNIVDVFGLGSVVQKIEDYFGKRVTGALLILVLVTALILCVNAIISFGIIPVIAFVRGVGTKSALDVAQSLAFAAVAGALGGIVFQFVLRLLLKRLLAQAENASERTGELIDLVTVLIDDASAQVEEVKATLRQTEKLAHDLEERERKLERRQRGGSAPRPTREN